jgi:hypothetical protein
MYNESMMNKFTIFLNKLTIFLIKLAKCILSCTNPKRLTLRGWAKLDDIRQKIDDEAEAGNYSPIPYLIYDYINTTVLISPSRKAPWYKVAKLYNEAVSANQPTKAFPLLSTKVKDKQDLPWEYLGRTWYFWVNTLAEKYGWSEKQIGKLDIDDAVGLYQEILIGEQLEKEWGWSLSEIAYPYNSSTKKSRYQPLERPDWMKPVMGKKKPVPKTKILRAMMPQGNVVQLSPDED